MFNRRYYKTCLLVSYPTKEAYLDNNPIQAVELDRVKDYLSDQSDDEVSLAEFEGLTEEFKAKFDELALPLREFLSGYWYRRVKDHILAPHPRQKEYINDARKIGVELELAGVVMPEWIEVLFGSKLEEVEIAY